MQVYKKQVKDIWLKAAVLGSLWGSVEIIAGSFFHNLRVPMAGTILAILGVSLMVAFGQMWKDKGLFWRAGLICAMMKSVSPSAILLGPMTGIFLEGILLELALLFFGRNFIGYLFGSILALYSVVLHKIISLLFVYGFDLIRISENMYIFVVKQLHVENVSFLKAIISISLVYVVLGIITVVMGWTLGKKINRKKQENIRLPEIELETNSEFISPESDKQSITLLIFHIFSIVLILSFINMISIAVASVLSVAYITFCILYYKRPLRYFKRPMFWIQILFFVVISIFFYNGFKMSEFYNKEGVFAGLKMGLRALVIVVGFSAISSELRNPLIKMMLYRKGFWQFYTSLSLAFSVLPHLMKNSANPKKLIKNPSESLINSILQSEDILNKFKQLKITTKILVISGNRQEGKTSFAKSVVKLCKDNNIKIGGFIAEGSFENNQRSKFEIIDLKTSEKELICSREGKENQQKIGPFYFYEEGINLGNKALNNNNLLYVDCVFIDELGPFELKGKGWTKSVEKLLQKSDKIQIWIIRENLIYDILRKFAITDAIIFDILKDKPEDVFSFIKDTTS